MSKWALIVFAMFVAAVYWTGHASDVRFREFQVKDCDTTQEARKDTIGRDLDSALAWDTAASARRADGDFAVAEQYTQIARRARRRAVRVRERIIEASPCAETVPKAPLLPVGG